MPTMSSKPIPWTTLRRWTETCMVYNRRNASSCSRSTTCPGRLSANRHPSPWKTKKSWSRQQQVRWKSSISATMEQFSETNTKIASSSFPSPSSAWRINLGREDDTWLRGPRSDKDWYTGPAPTPNFGSLPVPHLEQLTRPTVQAYFDNTWTWMETLFAGLNGEEGFYRPAPHGLRHPQIFYYGHTACLYINKLRLAGLVEGPVNAEFERLFETGVDEMTWDDMSKNDHSWPTVSEVWDYRKQVYQVVRHVIDANFDDTTPTTVTMESPLWALFMAMEHERIHLETSSVLFRELPVELVQTPQYWPALHPSATTRCHDNDKTSHPVPDVDYPVNAMIAIREPTQIQLGKPRNSPTFGWDNEYGTRSVQVPPFSASQFMVSNGEYWQFVHDGGYREERYWCRDGRAWRKHRNAKWPSFWQSVGPAGSHQFALRTIFEEIAMPWDWPVDVNYYEAKAYCQWKSQLQQEESSSLTSFRLLTEAEHHVIRDRHHNLDAVRENDLADHALEPPPPSAQEANVNLNLACSSQNPVQALPPSNTGHFDVVGNAWEWSEDHFNPLDNFEIHPLYDDFSTPCFDGKHHMVLGGSFISTGDEASVYARFHFRPHFLQHSGFRLVSSQHEMPAKWLSQSTPTTESSANNTYETDASLHMYLGLHYPRSGVEEGVPPIIPHNDAPSHGLFFPQRVARLLTSLNPRHSNGRALDVGCALGGSSFELAKEFEAVDAFDYSHSFVQAAKQIQESEDSEGVHFRIVQEADIVHTVRAVHDEDISPEICSKVNFFVGDACNLTEMKAQGILATYDGVIMSNLLCRLADPVSCLNGLPNIVNPGGIVVMTTPFTWLTEFTPRKNWLGGYYDHENNAVHSKDTLQKIMESNGFEKIHEQDMPLLIREHARKYQYIVSLASGWRRVQ